MEVIQGKAETHSLVTWPPNISSLLKKDTLLTPVRMCISAALWAKRKSGLVGEQWRILLVGMALGATLLLLLQEVRSHEYALTLIRKELVSETIGDDGHNTLYGYHDKHNRRLKKSLREKEMERDQSRDRKNYREKVSERYIEKERLRDREKDSGPERVNESVGYKSRRRLKEENTKLNKRNIDIEKNGEDGGNKLKDFERNNKLKEKEKVAEDEEEQMGEEEEEEAEEVQDNPDLDEGNSEEDTGFTSLEQKNSTKYLSTPVVAYPINALGRAKRFPQVLIFGVKKSGTESLAHFMTVHPDIHYTKREIHFFDHTKNYRKGAEWYRKTMPLTKPGELTVEKTPNYFEKDVGPSRVHHFNSSIKLIMIVRDPTRRLVSDYTHNSKHPGSYGRTEAYHTFSEMVLTKNGSINTKYMALRRGIYHIHYSNWLKFFPKEQILVLDGEAFMSNPYPTLKKVERFLGLRDYIREDHFVFSKKKNFFCKRIHDKTICMPSNKGRKHPNVSESVKKKLQDFYRPHNAIFEKMIDHKFSWP